MMGVMVTEMVLPSLFEYPSLPFCSAAYSKITQAFGKRLNTKRSIAFDASQTPSFFPLFWEEILVNS